MPRSIREIIRGQRILALPPEATVYEAACAMADRKVGAVLVVDGGDLVGIFTERDALVRVIAASRDPASTTLNTVISRNVHTVTPDRSLTNALHRMHYNGFRHMPVVEQGVPIGMVSVRDALAADLFEFEREEALQEHLARVM